MSDTWRERQLSNELKTQQSRHGSERRFWEIFIREIHEGIQGPQIQQDEVIGRDVSGVTVRG